MSKLRTSHIALVLSVVAVVAAGCGSSSKSKTTAKAPAAPSTPVTPSTPTATSASPGPALSKHDYGSKAGAALLPAERALKAANANPSDASLWRKLQSLLQQASSALSHLNPPADLAQLNSQLASAASDEATKAGKLASAIESKDQAAAKSAESDYNASADKAGAIQKQLEAKGVVFVAPTGT